MIVREYIRASSPPPSLALWRDKPALSSIKEKVEREGTPGAGTRPTMVEWAPGGGAWVMVSAACGPNYRAMP